MTTTAHRQLCKATTKAGAPCRAYAVSEAGFCNTHDPARAATMADARRRGGRARHGRRIGAVGATSPRVTLSGPADVLTAVESEVNALLTMERSISRARAVGYLLGVFVTTWESSELERRVAALEAEHDSKP